MDEYFYIKDICRSGLIEYLEKAFSKISNIKDTKILDIGCGTWVPTLWLADYFSGPITAIDSDTESINFLSQKITKMNLSKRVRVLCTSFFEYTSDFEHYDIILAEGFLNVIGFESGFKLIICLLKSNGYFIIHDEFKDHNKKCEFINDNNCEIINTFFLDESVWWNNYYKQLEDEINRIGDFKIKELFKRDILEIEQYKTNPSLFKSMYYVLKKL